ncbi:putative bifunctional diguanylate cyclase/phosphodiesterase [Actinoplanes italicus]|nr:EAL domain-containing protein [Actinoplanes italicus]
MRKFSSASPSAADLGKLRVAPGVDRRRPSTGRSAGTSWRRGGVWLTGLAAVTVLGASAASITSLQQVAEQRSELRILLNEFKAAAWQQDALRSEAMLARGLPSELADAREEIDDTVDTIGARFDRQDPDSSHTKAIHDAYLAYDTAADREFQLLKYEDLQGAEETAAAQTDPAFAALLPVLEDADGDYEALAEQASGRARTGTVVILACAALLIMGLVWQAQRIRARALRRATHQATHDALTGLPNRTLLRERTAAAIDRPRQDGTGTALLLIDLDRFKEVNDTLGHHYGDQLLVQAAHRMQQAVRSGETVARLGGDEFAVLLPSIAGEPDVTAVAARLHEALNAPFTLDGLTLTVAGSIGAALHPHHGDTADELLQRADIAMYTAKGKRIGYTVFDHSQDSTDPRKLTLASDLRQGIEQDQLVLHYQPKVDTRTGKVLGAEALVRWQHPEHGLIPPTEFIPLAEHTGLITPLTRFVLDTALRQCQEWLRDGHELSVAVNVSTHRLLDLDFPAEVADRLQYWQLPAHLLTVEITESAIMTDPDRALHVVQQLHALGVHLSIDDFGTGYSSMAYLKTLPVHELKIDRTFVGSMTTSDRDAVIVRSTAELGRNLGLRVIAEGVEDMATWQVLDAAGCDALQGYYISRPVTADAFATWLRHQRGAPAAIAP